MSPLYAPDLFRDEVVFITGGGTGIGRTVALELGALGAKIAICGRRPEPLERTAEALEAAGIEAFHAPCDIRKPEDVAALVTKIGERLGPIDVLINNAGGQFPMPAQLLAPKGFEAVVRNNLLGTWTVTHAVANQCFIPQKRGRIVSVIAQIARGFPGMSHTGAARAGVENLMKSLAVEWAQYGVRANAVAPGVIRTSGTDQYPAEILERGRAGNPLRRLGTQEEVSHLITYLASRYADYITGQTIYIDGGASVWGEFWEIPEEVPQYPPYPVPE